MILETITAGQVLAPIVSALVVVVLYHYLGREYLGAEENEYWNALRTTVLSAGDSTVRQKTSFALTNGAYPREYLGTVDLSSQELAYKFEEAGYVQCVLSGLKYRPANIDPNSDEAQFEDGSMAYRESKSDILPDALALKQTHVFWFENDDGTIDVYAHHEYSSLNPLVAWRHYRAVGQDADAGIKRAQAQLDTVGVKYQN